MDVSEFFDWPQTVAEQRDPLLRPISSLGFQPPQSFLRRSFPARWVVQAPNGSGDLEQLQTPTVILWTGEFDLVQPVIPFRSIDGSPSAGWRLELLAMSTGPAEASFLLFVIEDAPSTKRAVWDLIPPQPFYRPFRVQTAPTMIGGFSGALNGDLLVDPVRWFDPVPAAAQ